MESYTLFIISLCLICSINCLPTCILGMMAADPFIPEPEETEKSVSDDYDKQEQIIINEEVGHIIDAVERVRYNLYTDLEYFAEAQYFYIDGGGYVVEIEAATRHFCSVNRDTMAISILRDYIARYGLTKGSKQLFESKWHIVDYDVLGQPITKEEVNQFKPGGILSPYFLGPVAGGCLGFGVTVSIGLGMYMATVDQSNPKELPTACLYIGPGVGAIAGTVILDNFYEKRALKQIKHSRRLILIK